MKTFQEWLEKYNMIPEEEKPNILKIIKKLTGLGFKKKGDSRWEAGDYQFSLSNGILVLQSFVSDIPNFNKVLDYIKMIFEDVHVKSKVYINARGYGNSYREEPEAEIEVKRNLITLPDAQEYLEKATGRRSTLEVLKEIRGLIKSREVKVTGSSIKNAQVIKKLDITEQLISYKGTLYINSIGRMYQVLDMKDADNLIKFMRMEQAILRRKEIEMWKNDDLSNPFGEKRKF